MRGWENGKRFFWCGQTGMEKNEWEAVVRARKKDFFSVPVPN